MHTASPTRALAQLRRRFGELHETQIAFEETTQALDTHENVRARLVADMKQLRGRVEDAASSNSILKLMFLSTMTLQVVGVLAYRMWSRKYVKVRDVSA